MCLQRLFVPFGTFLAHDSTAPRRRRRTTTTKLLLEPLNIARGQKELKKGKKRVNRFIIHDVINQK